MTTTTTASTPAPDDVATPPAAPAGATVWSRLSDALNPILVREVQQAIKGRVFPLTILIALAISVVIAAVVASDYVDGASGRRAFDAGFATLVPLLVFVVPMQAYNSMRTELKGGIVEQLLLTRLSPGRVLFGKLQAAMVQFVLYVSVLSPLLATSYLLRGVDLLTILVSLGFAAVVCVTATAFAVSSAAQAVVPALQPIANLGIAFGLGMGTVSLVVMIGGGNYSAGIGALLRSTEFGAVVSGMALIALLSTILSWLAARSFLLHTFENKSTGFRTFLWTLPVLAYGWMLSFVDARNWDAAFPVLTFALLCAGVAFGLFMVTEQRDLSPRVRAHVPARAGRAALLAPLLPGRDRGMLCFALYSAVILLVAVAFWPPFGGGAYSMTNFMAKISLMLLAYAFVYLGIGRWVRDRLPDTVQGNHAGRFVLPVALFLFCIVPVLVDVLTRGDVRDWHIGHVMNPFWTIKNYSGRRWNGEVQATTIIVLLAAALLQLRVYLRGIRDVKQASAAHRARLAGGGAPATPSPDATPAAHDAVPPPALPKDPPAPDA